MANILFSLALLFIAGFLALTSAQEECVMAIAKCESDVTSGGTDPCANAQATLQCLQNALSSCPDNIKQQTEPAIQQAKNTISQLGCGGSGSFVTVSVASLVMCVTAYFLMSFK